MVLRRPVCAARIPDRNDKKFRIVWVTCGFAAGNVTVDMSSHAPEGSLTAFLPVPLALSTALHWLVSDGFIDARRMARARRPGSAMCTCRSLYKIGIRSYDNYFPCCRIIIYDRTPPRNCPIDPPFRIFAVADASEPPNDMTNLLSLVVPPTLNCTFVLSPTGMWANVRRALSAENDHG